MYSLTDPNIEQVIENLMNNCSEKYTFHGCLRIADSGNMMLYIDLIARSRVIISLVDEEDLIVDAFCTWSFFYILTKKNYVLQLRFDDCVENSRLTVRRLLVTSALSLTDNSSGELDVSIETHFTCDRLGHFGIQERPIRVKPSVRENADFLCAAGSDRFYVIGRGNNRLRSIPLSFYDEQSQKCVVTGAVLPPDIGVRQLCAGFQHCLILDNRGYLYSVGSGSKGELGQKDCAFSQTPNKIQHRISGHVRYISASGWHNVAITENGNAYVWGWNADGQLGFDKTQAPVLVEPTQLRFEPSCNIKTAAAGSRHTTFLTETGEVYTAGLFHKRNGKNWDKDSNGLPLCLLENVRRGIVDLESSAWTAILYY